MLVYVALVCDDGVHPADLELVARLASVHESPIEAALTQLLLGTDRGEFAAGFSSAFSSITAGEFVSVRIEDGVALVDFTERFVRTNNFSTSNTSAIVGRQIAATVFQFSDIDGIDFRVEGQRWCWWESTCEQAPFPLFAREDLAWELPTRSEE